jgi:zinc and cadmium transporter
MTITLSAFCTAIVIISVLGGILPLATILNHTRLQVYLSFSAGTMLGAAFFHMIPEAVRVGSAETVHWSAIGLLALFFLERFFSFHHHEGHQPGEQVRGARELEAAGARNHDLDHHHDGTLGPSASPGSRTLPWGSAAFGLAIHSLVGGIALASAVVADYRVGKGAAGAGLGVFVATFVHKPADALTITALMLRSGADRRYTHLVNLAFASMIPAGVALFWVGTSGFDFLSPGAWTAGALAFSAGTFLCIALSDLLPELQFHSHDRFKLSAALLAGFALMAGTAVLEPAGHRQPGAAHPPHQSHAP